MSPKSHRIAFRYSVSLFIAATLTACATQLIDTRVPEQDRATVRGQIDRSRGFYHWRTFAAVRVDNEATPRGFLSDDYDTVLSLSPGNHNLVVLARINDGVYGAGTWQAIVPITVALERGRSYRLNGDIRDADVQVWLEDSHTNQRIGEPAAAPYQLVPRGGATVPVFIPVR